MQSWAAVAGNWHVTVVRKCNDTVCGNHGLCFREASCFPRMHFPPTCCAQTASALRATGSLAVKCTFNCCEVPQIITSVDPLRRTTWKFPTALTCILRQLQSVTRTWCGKATVVDFFGSCESLHVTVFGKRCGAPCRGSKESPEICL